LAGPGWSSQQSLEPGATLSDSIDQLTLMADVRQSPLVALMNTLNVQGRTGQTGEADFGFAGEISEKPARR
jgi:hypothetical protein